MATLEEIRRALADHQPALISADAVRRAAVALVLSGSPGREQVLFIERAQHEGDPWSGHMAFPGGRVDPGDPHPRGAAERETLEEVRVDLAAAEPLGRLDDLQGRRHAGVPELVISAFVYHLPGSPRPEPNYEVREAFWFPLAGLREPERQVPYAIPELGGSRFPGILVGRPRRHVVWGLTYRFLEVFFRVVGRPLPNHWVELPGERGAAP